MSGAILSDCGRYRYTLTRTWDASLPTVGWVMLNPSTADAAQDDPTIRKCVKFSKAWGYGGLVVINLFAWRATDPRELWRLEPAEAIGRGWMLHCLEAISDCARVVTAWGRDGNRWGRGTDVLWLLDEVMAETCALKLCGNGEPGHPLYLRDDTRPFQFPARPTLESREDLTNE